MTEKEKYIESSLTYTEDNRLLENGLAIMMDWETPIMKKSADVICTNGGDILNIGFGLGIIDTYIKNKDICSHTIIECHPDVLAKMKENDWYNDTTVLEGFWQDHIEKLPLFDGVYFDTWKEQDFMFFIEHVHKIIKPGGIFSFFVSNDVGDGIESIPTQWFNVLKNNFDVSSETMNTEDNKPSNSLLPRGYVDFRTKLNMKCF